MMVVEILHWVVLILAIAIGLHTVKVGRNDRFQAGSTGRDLVPLHVDLRQGLTGQDKHV
jgi:hypothetical protein